MPHDMKSNMLSAKEGVTKCHEVVDGALLKRAAQVLLLSFLLPPHTGTASRG